MRYAKLIDPERALEEALKYIKPLGKERVKLEEAYNRVLATDIVATEDHPPFDRSAVDGYAVIADDTYEALEERPVRLKKVGSVPIASRPERPINRGETMYIATGAPLPPNANAVIPIEYALERGEIVEIFRAAYPGMNVQFASSDLHRGAVLLRSGTRLTRIHVSLIASQGIREVEVYKRPKAIVLGIGDELVEPGEERPKAKLYESNSFSISSLLASLGFIVERYSIKDDERQIEAKLSLEADLYVTIGGTSKGLGDLTYRTVERLGEVIFHGLKVKPGKPTFFGLIRGKPIVGLPGFPGSCAFIARFLLEPIARKLSGERGFYREYLEAELSREITNDTGRFLRIPVRFYGGKAVPVPRGSGDLSLFSLSEGVAMIEPRAIKARRAKVRILGRINRRADVVTSHDPALFAALEDALIVTAGSIGALQAIKLHEADFGGVHILTDEGYNRGLGVKVIRGYDREIGFVYREDVDFKGIEDLKRLRFVNRNVGSGTRILIDRLLESHGIDKSSIEGYRVELRSHNAVAAAVASGRADIGVAIRRVAEEYGLKFSHISREQFDFVVNNEEKLLSYGEAIKEEVLARVGYRLPKEFLEYRGPRPGEESSRGLRPFLILSPLRPP